MELDGLLDEATADNDPFVCVLTNGTVLSGVVFTESRLLSSL